MARRPLEPQTEKVGIRVAWKLWNVRVYVIGQAINMAGTWIHKVAAGWLVWELTHSATWLGLYSISELAPRLILWPIAGVVADRYDRQTLAMVAQGIAFLLSVTLAVLVYLDWITIWLLFMISVSLGVTLSFWQPARASMLPALVPRDVLPATVALASSMQNLSRFLGPAFAAPLFAYGGVEMGFAVNAASYLFALYCVWLLVLPPGKARVRGQSNVTSEVLDGLRYVRGRVEVLFLIVLIMWFSITVKPVQELYPGIADAVFGRGADGLSGLISATGVGALLSSLTLMMKGRIAGLAPYMILSTAVTAVAAFGFAVDDVFVIGLGLAVLYGFGVSMTNTVSQTLLQNTVDDVMLGRVMSIYGMIVRGMPSLGALAVGAAADRVGFHIPIMFCAGAGVVAMVYTVIMVPKVGARLERSSSEAAHDQARASPPN